jgi:hypothetical protein
MGAGSPWPAVWSPVFCFWGEKFCPNVKIYQIKGNFLSQYSHFLKKKFAKFLEILYI